MFEIKHSVAMKSRKRFLHLSSISDSNSFMTTGPELLLGAEQNRYNIKI